MVEDLSVALTERAHELQRRIAEHDAALAGLRSQLGSEVTDDEHDPEGTTLSAGWSLLAGIRRTEADELAEVRAALDRFADGSYGRCAGCDRPIPTERLRVRPMATRCVACASGEARR